jgi:hypothetical protein
MAEVAFASPLVVGAIRARFDLGLKEPKPSEVVMAFELLEEALLQLKQQRQKEETEEIERQNAADEALKRFALIKSEVLEPIFKRAVTLLVEEDLSAEVTSEDNTTTRSLTLTVDLSTEKVTGSHGSLTCRLHEDFQACQFGKAITRGAEPIFTDRLYKLQELTEEIVYRTTESFLLDLIASVSMNRSNGSTS